jgi:hypothetical protein
MFSALPPRLKTSRLFRHWLAQEHRVGHVEGGRRSFELKLSLRVLIVEDDLTVASMAQGPAS